MQNEILEITKKLIGFKTINGNNKETTACFNVIKKYFNPEIKTRKILLREYKKNNLTSLVFLNSETLNPDIILNGHIDVVSADDKSFIPKIKNGKLYGRGAADMKSEVAILMKVFKEAINSGIKKSIALILTSDEEISGQSGVGYLVNDIGYKGSIVITPDSGYNFELIIKQKGYVRTKIVSLGRSAHGSRPWLGENAIIELIKFYNDLEKKFQPLKKTKLLYQEGVSLNLGKIIGGESINRVPDKAEMYLDIRYSKKTDGKKIIDTINRLTQKHKINFKIIGSRNVLETNPNNYYLRKFREVAKKIIGRPIRIAKSAGGSDAGFFSNLNIPVILMVPNSGGKHGQNEWVEIKSLNKFYSILKEYIENI